MRRVPPRAMRRINHSYFSFSNVGSYVADVYFTMVLMGRGGTLVESKPFDRRVVGLNPALAAT